MRDCTNLIIHTVIAGTECKNKFEYHRDWTYTFPHRGQSSFTPKALQAFRPLCLENCERYELDLYDGHIGNHIWAFVFCHDLGPWMTLKGQTRLKNCFSTVVYIFKKMLLKASVILIMVDLSSPPKLYLTNMTFDLSRSFN